MTYDQLIVSAFRHCTMNLWNLYANFVPHVSFVLSSFQRAWHAKKTPFWVVHKIHCCWCGHRAQPCCKIKNRETFFLASFVGDCENLCFPQNGICVGAWQARHCVLTDNRGQPKATLYALCVQIQLKELARVIWGSHSHLISWLELLPTKVLKLQFYNECNC